MTVKCNTMVNILSANTENIGGKAFGQMLIELPESAEERKRITDYLDNRGIHYEVGAAAAAEASDATGDVQASAGHAEPTPAAAKASGFDENLMDLTEDVRKGDDL